LRGALPAPFCQLPHLAAAPAGGNFLSPGPDGDQRGPNPRRFGRGASSTSTRMVEKKIGKISGFTRGGARKSYGRHVFPVANRSCGAQSVARKIKPVKDRTLLPTIRNRPFAVGTAARVVIDFRLHGRSGAFSGRVLSRVTAGPFSWKSLECPCARGFPTQVHRQNISAIGENLVPRPHQPRYPPPPPRPRTPAPPPPKKKNQQQGERDCDHGTTFQCKTC